MPAPSAATTPICESLASASAKWRAASASLLPSIGIRTSRLSFAKTSSSPIKRCHESPLVSASALTRCPLILKGCPFRRRKQPLRISPNRQQATSRYFLKIRRLRRTASFIALGLIISCAANSSPEFSSSVMQARATSRMRRLCR